MRGKLFLVFIIILIQLVAGCAGKQLLRVDLQRDVQEELIVQKDPAAAMAVEPVSPQKKENDGVMIEINYLRVMKESDYRCINRRYDPLNPQLIFAFRMINNGDRIRYYTPIFAFKGAKTLDLADTDPCMFFKTYGAVNYLLAKPGNKIALSCQSKDGQGTGLIPGDISRPVTLYPDIPVYGILIVSQERLEQALEDEEGVKTSTVKGWAAFFEKVQSDQKPNSFRFNYRFTRRDWREDVQYRKMTPYTYRVNVYQKTMTIPVLGTIDDGLERERQPGSEEYADPTYERIGTVEKE